MPSWVYNDSTIAVRLLYNFIPISLPEWILNTPSSITLHEILVDFNFGTSTISWSQEMILIIDAERKFRTILFVCFNIYNFYLLSSTFMLYVYFSHCSLMAFKFTADTKIKKNKKATFSHDSILQNDHVKIIFSYFLIPFYYFFYQNVNTFNFDRSFKKIHTHTNILIKYFT